MRQTFTFRLDDDLVSLLAERVTMESRSRNWVINAALRDWLKDGATADDTPPDHRRRSGGSGDEMSPDAEESVKARAASAGGSRGAQPPRSPLDDGPLPPPVTVEVETTVPSGTVLLPEGALVMPAGWCAPREAVREPETAEAEPALDTLRDSENDGEQLAPPHWHRFTAPVPDSERYVQGVRYARFGCSCGIEMERRASK